MKIITSVLIAFTLIVFFSCNDGKELNSTPLISNYLHLSHTRTNSNPAMDSVVEQIDYSKYDMLWLGGDMAHLTSLDNSTIKHVDSVFKLGNPTTMLALGNHDYSDLNRIKQFTKRPPYYAFNKNKITVVVIDSQDSLSSIIGDQKKLLFSVLDTLQETTHLVLLHHKLIWMYGNADLKEQQDKVPNAGFGECFHCINPNNFNSEIYPRLVAVKEKGIDVICIAGDIGFRAKEFKYRTPEGIHFLASGIESNTTGNKALLFKHNQSNDSLTWEFTDLTKL